MSSVTVKTSKVVVYFFIENKYQDISQRKFKKVIMIKEKAAKDEEI